MTIDVNGPARKGAGLFGLDTSVADAKVVVVPVPFEATVSYAAGTARGPAAVIAASHQVDLLDADVGSPWASGIALDPGFSWLPELNRAAREAACRCIEAVTDGAAPPDADRQLVEEAGLRVNRAVTERCAEHIRDGRITVVLGGDHSVSYGAIAATAAAMGDRRLGILHIDAHADLREAYEGFTWSHASVMRNVIERMPNVRLVQVGIRDFCEAEVELIKAQPGRITTYFDAHLRAARLAGHWPTVCAAIINELPENVYLSLDIDGLEPSLCSSTGTPVPGGLSFDELVSLVDLLVQAGRRIVGLDVVEVAPAATLGDDELGSSWDANVGARLLYKLIGFALLSRGAPRPDLPKAPGIR